MRQIFCFPRWTTFWRTESRPASQQANRGTLGTASLRKKAHPLHRFVNSANTALKTLTFGSSKEFRSWLQKNHAGHEGIWLRIFKKDSGGKSITYAEALDQALCYGWIDGQKQAKDERSWLQKFSPRRTKSG